MRLVSGGGGWGLSTMVSLLGEGEAWADTPPPWPATPQGLVAADRVSVGDTLGEEEGSAAWGMRERV